MEQLSDDAQNFLTEFENRRSNYERVATIAETSITDLVRGSGVPCHAVTARVKTINSLRAKLRSKNYNNPRYKAIDTIGVRVVLYYSDHVDQVVQAIVERHRINHKESTDKRTVLQAHEFGYRSVHLILSLSPFVRRAGIRLCGGQRWCEVQVRSAVEHAWASVSHEVIYKSGVEYPDTELRKLNAIAGSLEVVDAEFARLRERTQELVNSYVQDYHRGVGIRQSLDAARVAALIGANWRGYDVVDVSSTYIGSLPVRLGRACVELLRACRIKTGVGLSAALRSNELDELIDEFAALKGIDRLAVSDLAVTVLIALSRRPRLLVESFPEVIADPAVQRLLAERRG